MKKNLYIAAVIFLLPSFVYLVQSEAKGQTPQVKKNDADSATANVRTERESVNSSSVAIYSRVLNILSETADEAKSWDDSKTAAQVLARIADLVWDIDPLTAGTYLKRAWEKSKDVKESDEIASKYRNASPRVESSGEVLRVARKRSPELAQKWLDELADVAEEDFKKRNNGAFDDRTARSAVLLQVALQSAAENPQVAAGLATESLRDGISFGLQMVLVAIHEKDSELAQTVLRSALRRMQTDGIQNPGEILILFSYIYTPGQIFAASNSGNQGQSTVAITPNRPPIVPVSILNPPLAFDFLRVSSSVLLRLPYPAEEISAREQTSVLSTILYRIGDSLPQESQALRERLTGIMAGTNYVPTTKDDNAVKYEKGETAAEYLSRMIDKLVEQAEKESNPLRRDILFAQAALKTNAEMFERGKSIAGKIQDKTLREQVTNVVIYRKTLKEVELSNFDNAYKILGKNSNLKQRAASLIVGATKLKKTKDTLQLGFWLSDAEKIFGKAEKSDVDWVKIGFGLTGAYSEVSKNDSSDAFSKTAKLIEEKTKVEIGDDRAPLASGFSGIEFINFLSGTKGFGLGSAVLTFSRDDFEDALSNLKTIKNAKTRGFGIMALCEKYIIESQKYFREMEKKAANNTVDH